MPAAACEVPGARSTRDAMNRALLAAILCLSPAAVPACARPPDNSSADPDEDALLRGPVRPSPRAPGPAAAPPIVQAPARPMSRGRRATQATDDGHSSAAASTDDQGSVALELSTSGFASGSL